MEILHLETGRTVSRIFKKNKKGYEKNSSYKKTGY